MTIDPVSFALGAVSVYAFSTVLFIALCVAESREERKQRERALDQLLAEVGVACLERPTNVRTN